MAIEAGRPTEELPTVPTADMEADDAWEELPGRPLRKRLGPLTVVLAACLLAAGAFYAGVRVEKSKVKSSSSSGTAALAALASRFAAGRTGATGTAGAAGTGGGAGAGGFARAGTTGTITLIDGSNVYVTQSDGSIVKVATNPGTTISVTSAGTVANLHPGDTVTVTGPTGTDGTITATALRDGGAGGGGGSGRGAGAGTGAGATRGGGAGGATAGGGAPAGG
ncbi:MAG TPA: hypothetical protein VGI06_12205 [Acidimicrobiales bacterium]